MIIAPYRDGKPYDEGVDRVVNSIRRALAEKDDDFFIICTGTRGTGKTTLMMHFYEAYAGVSNAFVSQIALTRPDFATALKNAKEVKLYRFAGFDEGNVSKREALTKWNRAIMDLYYSIRGLRIFHWWSNPSAEMIDKPFIEECVKGLIFIFTKDVKRPRLYYYFTKEDLLDILEKHGNLKHRTLKKYAKEYAYYRGWFKDYDGPLKSAYLAKKQDRMEQKVDEFFNEYGAEENSTIPGFAKQHGIDERTAKKYFEYGVKVGLLKEKDDYLVTGLKRVRLTAKGCDNLLFIVLNHAKTGGRVGFEPSGGGVPLNRRAEGDGASGGVGDL